MRMENIQMKKYPKCSEIVENSEYKLLFYIKYI